MRLRRIWWREAVVGIKVRQCYLGSFVRSVVLDLDPRHLGVVANQDVHIRPTCCCTLSQFLRQLVVAAILFEN
jgi:hypothetical protein